MLEYVYIPLFIVLIIYGIAMTVAVIVTNSSNDECRRKINALEKEREQLIKQINSSAPAPAPAPVQAAAPAPVASAPAATQTQALAPAQAPAPAWNYQPAPSPSLPTYTYSKDASTKPRKDHGTSAVGVSFAVGVLLMVIAAAVFISATWQTMAAGWKCVVLALVVAVVYGFSFLCRKKLKLEKTSSVLYLLGSLITPLAVMVGFFAFESRETIIMLGCCALALGITGFVGYKAFGSKLQVAISYLGFVWVEIFIFMETIGELEGFVLGACFAALISGIIHFVKPTLKYFGIFAEVTAYAALSGFLASVMIDAEHIAAAFIAQGVYFAALFLLSRRRSWIKYFSALVPVYFLITLSLHEILSGEMYVIVATLTIVLTILLYRMSKQANFASNAIISCLMSLMILMESSDLSGLMECIGAFIPVLCVGYFLITSKNKVEKNVYCYLQVLSALIFIETLTIGVIPYYIFLAFTAAAIITLPKFKQLHLAVASVCATIICFFAHSEDIFDGDAHRIIFMAVAVALYVAVVFMGRKLKVTPNQNNAMRLPVLPLLLLSSIVLTFGMNDIDIRFIMLVVLDIVFFAATLFDKDNYFGLLPAASFMIAVVSKMLDNGVNELLTGVIFLIVFVAIGRIFVSERIFKKNRIDWLTILAGFACYIPSSTTYHITFLIGVYIMSFIGRFSDAETLEERIKHGFRTILSFATGMFAISLAIGLPEVEYVDFELRLAIMLAAAAIVHFAIRPHSSTRWIWFSAVAGCIEIEASRAMSEGYLIPLTLVSLCVCGIFIYSFFVKRRSWFILAISNIAIIGVMFAITFWESKLWWIYLLVLGGILIGTASVNESKRRKAIESGLEDKKIRLFDSWEW